MSLDKQIPIRLRPNQNMPDDTSSVTSVMPKVPVVDSSGKLPPVVPASIPREIPKKPQNVTLIEGINFSNLKIAYYSMEIAVSEHIITYAGGLGVLAGDMLRSASDLGLPMVGVTLLYRDGYVRQHLDASGWQEDGGDGWDPTSQQSQLKALPQRITLEAPGRTITVSAWLYLQKGVTDRQNPIIFLDTDIEGNTPADREITKRLYGAGDDKRFLQEYVLGVGGTRMLETLGATGLRKYHMNEGHSALLSIELLRKKVAQKVVDPVGDVRRMCVFTTHTPVSAGHDKFADPLVRPYLSLILSEQELAHVLTSDGLHMTELALKMSGYVNGVAKQHGEVSRHLFPGYQIESITNGVHAGYWTSKSLKALYDKYLKGWESDPYSLRYALAIPTDELWRAHQDAKKRLLGMIAEKTGKVFDPEIFTIGMARRATSYKRTDLLFHDLPRLERIASRGKGLQIVVAGKAHPSDHEGKLMIQRIIRDAKRLEGKKVSVVYLENYDMPMAKLVIPGVDIWLNTPQRPLEASGTSGMKAALNCVPQLSILDGWWLEGHIEGVTGWAIGKHPEEGVAPDERDELEDMYGKLEYSILPRYEFERERWVKVMRQTVAINGSFFNTHRLIEQYVLNAYFRT